MSNQAAISVESPSKRYRLGVARRKHDTLRDLFSHQLSQFFAKRSLEDTSHRVLWALKDVSFEVREGDIVGVVGRNGAGKSTLLKVLTRITKPTQGRALLRGRVGSLLEVGTGFHPELSGRENVYFNGAVLGMSRSEVKRKFDEIVAFSGIERFIDTPVKRYSSGMQVRLAFAVAAHLEPEILIVDEVLAVGDAEFQKKCLNKMREVGRDGRTVLFVSHSMTAVRHLCNSALWLRDGSIVKSGDTHSVTDDYLRGSYNGQSVEDVDAILRSLPDDPVVRLDALAVRQNGQDTRTVLTGTPVEVEVIYTIHERVSGLRIIVDLLDDAQVMLLRSHNDENEDEIPTREPGTYRSVLTIPATFLAPRNYEISIRVSLFNGRWPVPDGVRIPISAEKTTGINRAYRQDTTGARLQPLLDWRTEVVGSRVAAARD